MNTTWAGKRYWTTAVQNNAEGYAGVRLHEESKGNQSIAADVTFWDASGQFYVQTMNREVPLEIIETLIAEAKAHVHVR
jgi:hypothetical protein